MSGSFQNNLQLAPLSITKQHNNMQIKMLLYNSLTGYSNEVCKGWFPSPWAKTGKTN